MRKGRRHNITQSLDAYLSEDHGEDQNAQKTATPSPIQPATTEGQLDTETNNEFVAPDGQQNDERSEFDAASGGEPSDMDGDIELNAEEETEEEKRRGKTKLKHVWNMPKGQRIVVKCNEVDQPIGEEAGVLGKFLGMVARNGCLCSLSYKDWRLLIGKKDRVTDELKNKEDILKQVKKRFLYPARLEKWILKTIAERWRQHKSNLKSMYFDVHKSKEANYSNVPPGVIDDQWVALVNNWMTLKAQDMSEANKINCSKKKGPHSAGTKSFARKREELKDKDSGKKYPHRAVLYIHTHQSNSSNNTNPHVGALKELITEHPDLADNSEGKIAWKGDALTRILGEEKPGHVHGMGLVPNPNKVLECSTSSKLKGLNLTSGDATSSEDVVSLKLQMEKLMNHVQAQDAAIQKLQQKKTIPLEQNQRQPEPLDEPLSETNDVQPTGKRKRVYLELHDAEFSMLQDVNDTTMDQIEDEGTEDQQGRNKLNKPQDKRKAPNAQQGKVIQGKTVCAVQKMGQIENEGSEDQQERNKLNKTQDKLQRKSPNAEQGKVIQGKTICAVQKRKATNTHQGKVIQGKTVSVVPKMKTQIPQETAQPMRVSTSLKSKTMESPADNRFNTSYFVKAAKPSITERPTQEDILTGSEVRIKSWRNQSKIVALGRVLSRDPNTKVGGCKIGNEFWMLRVGLIVVPKEPLIRPYDNFEFIGDVGQNPIAWPSSYVEKA